MEVSQYAKNVFLKNGKNISIRIGIHTGQVISGVIGDTKPQFSLLGDTLNKANNICKLTKTTVQGNVSVSKQTHHFLELYTNNYSFKQKSVSIKGQAIESVFTVSLLRGRQRDADNNAHSKAIKNFDGQLNKGEADKKKGENDGEGESKSLHNRIMNNENKSEEFDDTEYDNDSNKYQNSHYYKREHEKDLNINIQVEDKGDEESNKTDAIEDGTMNVFGFQDDLNLDDRLIIQNATDNQIYNLVERPKYLLQFDLKDSE